MTKTQNPLDISIRNPGLNDAISILQEKKAQNIVIYDLRGLTQLFDHAVIATGLSSTQIDVIKRSLEREMKKKGIKPLGVEGSAESGWVLVDYIDLLFMYSTRQSVSTTGWTSYGVINHQKQ